MVSVAVGTRNPVKLRGVEKAFREFLGLGEVSVVGVEVPGLYTQPVGLTETMRGACHRAEEARRAPGMDYYIGVEAGLVEVGDRVVDIHIACLIDREGRRFIGLSPGFEVSRTLYTRALELGELDRAVEEVTGVHDIGSSRGLIGLVTEGLVVREDLVASAVVMALVSERMYRLFRDYPGS